ncbi:hypothetical protein KEF85_06335 [Methylomonas paludis]|uniref:Uncharacterized protein n=1 Tax=Methylomonas paludis TaxID=1173101 RepID=A0A975MQD3_9GAMM|nr:hypothetical protein [Methylomonas paludis]QWF72067.1 hypothetical protein KEF85_06335 [Methylomonas paludis]
MKSRRISTLQKTRFKTYKKKSANSFLSNVLAGFGRFFPSQPRNYSHPTGGGFYADALAMQKDFRNIGKDLQTSLRKYGQTETD